MPSPDLTPYVDLTIFDADTQTLIDAALDDATTKLPGWVPREGNTEVVLIEALALIVVELVYAINRLPDAIAEVLLELYGLSRDLGAAATSTATFTLSDALGHTVPAGTRLLLALSGGEEVEWTTDVQLVVASGSTTGTVAITATEAGAAPNEAAAGTDLELLDAVVFVEAVELAASPAGGVDPESGAAFLDRGVQLLRRLVDTLVLPEHFTARALEEPAVERATTLDNYNPATGPNPGDNPGHVTVAVAGPGGAALAPADKTALDDAMEARAAANLAVHLIDPTITAVAVTATVVRQDGYTAAQVQSNVAAALEAYLSPDAWEWDATVYRNELLSIIDQAQGVRRVVTLDAPAADVALSGDAPLADAGTITVTVQAPS